jgi:hypothetical protein
LAPSVSPDDAPLDVAALVGSLERHGVEYLVVGGIAAQGYGAARPTKDFDCLVRREQANLDRLAVAMVELGARLRVGGLSDEEARALPVQMDGAMLAQNEISTWRTDAGDLDVLTNLPARDGRRLGYEDLVHRANIVQGDGFVVRAANLADIVASKEWADRPKDREALAELREILAEGPNRAPEPTGGSTTGLSIGQLIDMSHPSPSETAPRDQPSTETPLGRGPEVEHGRTGPEMG